MPAWTTSRELTATTYDLVKTNRALMSWAMRAIFLGAATGAIGVVPGVAVLAASSAPAAVVLGVALLVAGLFGATVVANMQMAALVVAADAVLHDRPVDAPACRTEARRHTGAIVGWSAISTVVGLVVGIIRGDNGGGLASTILRTLFAGLAAAAWSLISFLALPVLVLEGLGAVSAVKRSAHLMRARWGEAVAGTIRIGARFGLRYVLPGLVLVVGGIVAGLAVGAAGGVALAGVGVTVGVALMLIGTVLTQTCRNVFGVALYRWVADNEIVGPYSEADLAGAARARSDGT
jgi:hypothetical protein